MKLVCIPAFNEEKTIGSVVKLSLLFADKVVVCDDGSTDNTATIAKEHGAYVISHKKNLGYGAAITSLFSEAREENADIMISLDGDGQHDPKQIPLLVDPIIQNNLDVVIGSRFLNGDSNSPKYRKAGAKIITSVSNVGTNFKVTDSQSGFRAYSKKAIETIHPTENGMAVSTEILQKASNNSLKLLEVPISISYGENTSSQNPVPHGVGVLANTLKFISVKHPLIFYGLPGLFCMIIGFTFGYNFITEYFEEGAIFYGSLLASISLLIVGAVLITTSIILFSMSVLIKDNQ